MFPTIDVQNSPWHPGERALQASVGLAERMDIVGRKTIRDHLTEQDRLFYPALPFIIAGTVDRRGDAWATILAGQPGFLQSPDDATLTIAAPREHSDPADAGLDDGDAIGLLGIELTTRRRNRLNGTVHRGSDDRFAVTVSQSFGNCPKYISPRAPVLVRDPDPTTGVVETLQAPDEALRTMIATADTAFVASYVDREDGRRQVDVSHRGGRRGFMRLGQDGVLTVPDYAGNMHFATLGNMLVNPHAGLLLVDFATGTTVQISGRTEVLLETIEVMDFPGAERLWRLRPTRIVRRKEAVSVQEGRPGALPLDPIKGSGP